MIDYDINKMDEFLKRNFETNQKTSLALSKVNFVEVNDGSTVSIKFNNDKNNFDVFIEKDFVETLTEEEFFSALSFVSQLITEKFLSKSNGQDHFRHNLAIALASYSKIDNIPDIGVDIYKELNFDIGKTYEEYYSELKHSRVYNEVYKKLEKPITYNNEEFENLNKKEDEIISFVEEKLNELSNKKTIKNIDFELN